MIIQDGLLLKDLEGRTIKDGDNDLTVVSACKRALGLCGLGPDGRPADYKTQKNRYEIARRIHDGENISTDDIEEIRRCAALVFAQPAVVGPLGEALNRLVLRDEQTAEASGEKKSPSSVKEE